jgi:UDP-N-acetylmuramoyl-tripeptide--D-alanyl-D-alanine ligase
VGGLFPLVFNEKNYNNQVGVAKTILAIEGSPRYGVFELGTNHKGEIEVLSRMVRPHVSLITNINPSHLEGLSDLEGVRREKLSLFETTLPGGTLFVNVDDPSLAAYRPKEDLSATTFGIGAEADYTVREIRERGIEGFDVMLVLPGTEVRTRVRLLGRHNLYNVLAAAALAHFMGVPAADIAAAIPEFQPYKGRFRPIESRKGYVVIDDAYNANPASMQWAINTVSALPCAGKRIAVLGEMKELGEKKEGYHRELGRTLKESDLSLVLLLGEGTKVAFDEIGNGRARHFDDKARLIDFLSGKIGKGDIVLVKGSRALGMDEIVEALI